MNGNALDTYFKAQLEARKDKLLLRNWGPVLDSSKVDFISNDYLGFRKFQEESKFKEELVQVLKNEGLGSSGSRMVSGQSRAIEKLEKDCAAFFKSDAAMFFPNGYMANLALLSTVATRHDTFIYDEQCHVSLKDSMRLSPAKRYPYLHNDVEDLEKKCKPATGKIFIITEALFSMEGDIAPLSDINEIVNKYDAHLILDKAHSTGTFGETGNGLWNSIKLQEHIFARIYTFGKALGASGAVICTNQITYNYLMNYAHPAIYSTAPMPIQAWVCAHQLEKLQSKPNEIKRLQNLINYWNQKNKRNNSSISNNPNSPIQYIKATGNEHALNLAKKLQTLNYQLKPMLSPTISTGQERLRITLHAFNTEDEISSLLNELRNI